MKIYEWNRMKNLRGADVMSFVAAAYFYRIIRKDN